MADEWRLMTTHFPGYGDRSAKRKEPAVMAGSGRLLLTNPLEPQAGDLPQYCRYVRVLRALELECHPAWLVFQVPVVIDGLGAIKREAKTARREPLSICETSVK